MMIGYRYDLTLLELYWFYIGLDIFSSFDIVSIWFHVFMYSI